MKREEKRRMRPPPNMLPGKYRPKLSLKSMEVVVEQCRLVPNRREVYGGQTDWRSKKTFYRYRLEGNRKKSASIGKESVLIVRKQSDISVESHRSPERVSVVGRGVPRMVG